VEPHKHAVTADHAFLQHVTDPLDKWLHAAVFAQHQACTKVVEGNRCAAVSPVADLQATIMALCPAGCPRKHAWKGMSWLIMYLSEDGSLQEGCRWWQTGWK
jgi:hypothetical protein